jgi:mono/diheme cytochrome c family protein
MLLVKADKEKIAMRQTMIVLLFLVGVVAAFAVAKEPATTPEADSAKERSEIVLEIPAKEKNRRNPVEPTPENIEFGLKLFSSQCAMCHGPRGAGNGDLAQKLVMPVPDFTNPEGQKKRTDGELFYIITKGHGRMPADGERLSAEWRWRMVHAIRSMPAGSPTER